MEVDERKRTFDGGIGEVPAPVGSQIKRSRPEDVLGGVRDDPTKATTRMLLNRTQFSRIIGKGGGTIALIRSSTGVYMKGTDIDEEYRLVVIHGPLEQVINAFDMITEALSSGEAGPSLTPRTADILALTLLLEHSKAGKAVGVKGAMIQTIKLKSGAASIRIEKEPLEIHGVALRKIAIEGGLNSVRRAHQLVLELYIEPGLSGGGLYGNGMPLQNNSAIDTPSPFGHHRSGFPSGPAGFDPMMGPGPGPGSVDPSASQPLHHPVPVPFPSLTNFGVQPETVRQLTDMKAYLWRHFGLDLTIAREMPAPSPMGMPGMQMPLPRLPEHQPYPAPYAPAGMAQRQLPPPGMRPGPDHGASGARRPSYPGGPMEITFTVPKSCVGAVIGKGGQNLKDLLAEHGVRVYIEKDDVGGKRSVVLSFVGGENVNLPSHEAILRCQQHIEAMVADQLAKQKSSESQYVDGLNE